MGLELPGVFRLQQVEGLSGPDCKGCNCQDCYFGRHCEDDW